MFPARLQTRVAATTESSMESRGCFSLRVCFLFIMFLSIYLPETEWIYAAGSAADICMPQRISPYILLYEIYLLFMNYKLNCVGKQ